MASADEISVEDELSRQYFKFTPSEFIQDFSELIIDEITAITQEIIKNIESLPLESGKDKLLEECDAIHEILLNKFTVELKELAPIITEVFTIPKNVSLPLSGLTQNFTNDEIKKLEHEVQELRLQNEKELRAIKVIEAKIHILEMLEPVYTKIDGAMPILDEFIKNSADMQELKNLDNFHTLHEMFPNLRNNINTRLQSLKFNIIDNM